MAAASRKLVLDTNCFIDASRTEAGAEHEGLVLADVRKSFMFDILVAWSCREIGAVLVSRNMKDLSRIAKVFTFEFVAPYPV